ncbi:hypothetical protein FJY70_05120, partial [candidate division WOR-3 bacterium]|nr:hypothetical protein [candidate division WOR-3 bacterium]
MAIEKVTKVLVAVHREHQEPFLERLQRLGLMHVLRTESATTDSRQAGPQSRRVIQAIEALAPRTRKKGGAGAKPLSRREFDDLAARYDYSSAVERLAKLVREQTELASRVKSIETETQRLAPWTELAHSPSEMYGLENVTVWLGKFPGEEDFRAAADALREEPASAEVVARAQGEVRALVAAIPEFADRASRVLSEHHFEAADLHNVDARPVEALANLRQEAERARRRTEEVGAEMDRLGAELPQLKVAADALANQETRQATAAALARTDSVVLVHGWVRKRDLKRLERLVSESQAAAMTEVGPEPGEEPPVALV